VERGQLVGSRLKIVEGQVATFALLFCPSLRVAEAPAGFQ
jgi:hypothetical protein